MDVDDEDWQEGEDEDELLAQEEDGHSTAQLYQDIEAFGAEVAAEAERLRKINDLEEYSVVGSTASNARKKQRMPGGEAKPVRRKQAPPLPPVVTTTKKAPETEAAPAPLGNNAAVSKGNPSPSGTSNTNSSFHTGKSSNSQSATGIAVSKKHDATVAKKPAAKKKAPASKAASIKHPHNTRAARGASKNAAHRGEIDVQTVVSKQTTSSKKSKISSCTSL